MEITVRPIAYVENSRKTVEDDDWGEVVSKIEVVPHIDETLFFTFIKSKMEKFNMGQGIRGIIRLFQRLGFSLNAEKTAQIN